MSRDDALEMLAQIRATFVVLDAIELDLKKERALFDAVAISSYDQKTRDGVRLTTESLYQIREARRHLESVARRLVERHGIR